MVDGKTDVKEYVTDPNDEETYITIKDGPFYMNDANIHDKLFLKKLNRVRGKTFKVDKSELSREWYKTELIDGLNQSLYIRPVYIKKIVNDFKLHLGKCKECPRSLGYQDTRTPCFRCGHNNYDK
jgi:hypothetical protein